ncbi:MAG: hypothetical protein B7Y36_15365 [Novosphingobium sp. 28-62-57]|nr:MAG: hypothetical protein B7Y36_15365 [Novosphingobium sp. 28-62-57]
MKIEAFTADDAARPPIGTCSPAEYSAAIHQCRMTDTPPLHFRKNLPPENRVFFYVHIVGPQPLDPGSLC